MFSTSDIVANTNSKSFQRGSLIAEKEGSVVARRFTEGKEIRKVIVPKGAKLVNIVVA